MNASTGKYTGRSPKDKFIVTEPSYRDNVDWETLTNLLMRKLLKLYNKVLDYLGKKMNYTYLMVMQEATKIHV